MNVLTSQEHPSGTPGKATALDIGNSLIYSIVQVQVDPRSRG